MNGGNAFLEEMLVLGEQKGTSFSKVFNLNGQKIYIPTMELTDEDFEVLNMYIQRKNGSLTLVFVVMIYHFFDRFNEENLNVFINSGSKKVRETAKKILDKIIDNPNKLEHGSIVKELILSLTAQSIFA